MTRLSLPRRAKRNVGAGAARADASVARDPVGGPKDYR